MEKPVVVVLTESEVGRVIAAIKPLSKSLGHWQIAEKLEAALAAARMGKH
jgi:hypothetical protein